MNDITHMIFALIAGFLIGSLFFWLLWLSLKKSMHSKTPVLWIFGSFFLRVSIALFGFYFVAGGNWKALLLCLIGFTSARYLLGKLIPGLKHPKFHLNKEQKL